MPAGPHHHVRVDQRDKAGTKHRDQHQLGPDLAGWCKKTMRNDAEKPGLIEPGTDHQLAHGSYVVPVLGRAASKRFFIGSRKANKELHRDACFRHPRHIRHIHGSTPLVQTGSSG